MTMKYLLTRQDDYPQASNLVCRTLFRQDEARLPKCSMHGRLAAQGNKEAGRPLNHNEGTTF